MMNKARLRSMQLVTMIKFGKRGVRTTVSPRESSALEAQQVYENAIVRFESAGIPDAEQSARYLLADVMGIGYRLTDFNEIVDTQRNHKLHREYAIESTAHNQIKGSVLTPEQADHFENHCQKREKRMPVQYIIGHWEFYGMELACKPPVLIPRPETEELVELIVENTKIIGTPPTRILDIGCGTGAIGLALLRTYPNATCIAIDVDPAAVALAGDNALSTGVQSRYTALHTSFKDYASNGSITDKYDFDLIVSNPPYISTAEIPLLQAEVGLYESHIALHGGTDGLDIAREIWSHAPQLSSHSRCDLWMELAIEHPEQVCDYLRDMDGRVQSPWKEVRAVHDLSKRPRFFHAFF